MGAAGPPRARAQCAQEAANVARARTEHDRASRVAAQQLREFEGRIAFASREHEVVERFQAALSDAAAARRVWAEARVGEAAEKARLQGSLDRLVQVCVCDYV